LTKDVFYASGINELILSYKDFDPSFVDSELAAQYCYHRKENEAKRLGKTLNVLNTFLSPQLTKF
jgi:elongation factor Ts